MLKNITSSFAQALESIRSHFFHTFLSILGIVIGVGALVAILSLIDGMEQYANEQISTTTDLKTIAIRTQTYKEINHIRIDKDTFAVLNVEDFNALLKSLKGVNKGALNTYQSEQISVEGISKQTAAFINATTPLAAIDFKIAVGQLFTAKHLQNKDSVAIVNHHLAKQLVGEGDQNALLNKVIHTKNFRVKIIGILKEDKSRNAQLHVPITLLSAAALQAAPPAAYMEAKSVEQVADLKTQIEAWLKNRYPTLHKDFEVQSNELRVKQAAQGFLLFRVVMGLIVGISILVGGIGVMNVLLISVTERTSEIGIRKAMGANRKDIRRLFLSESIVISLLGSMIGLLLGVLVTLVAVPIIKAFIDVPFHAAYTWNTFLIIMVIAVLIGVIFGTYPAMKAARLDPVEAMRRE